LILNSTKTRLAIVELLHANTNMAKPTGVIKQRSLSDTPESYKMYYSL